MVGNSENNNCTSPINHCRDISAGGIRDGYTAEDTPTRTDPKVPDSLLRMEALDWIRGLAALWVVFYHIDITLQKEKYFNLDPISNLTSQGFRGVDIFFILSGFVMTGTLFRSHTSGVNGAVSFAIRRLLRIFPLYLLIYFSLYMIMAKTGIGAPPHFDYGPQFFLQNLFLIPRDDLTSFIPVSAWTLSHELMFYIVCLTGFINIRTFLILLFLWSSTCAFLYLTGQYPNGLEMPFSLYNVYFLLGSIAFYLSKMFKINLPNTMLFIGIFLVAIAVYFSSGGQEYALLSNLEFYYVIGFFVIVLSMSQFQNRRFTLLTKLGDISYSVYLVNYPLISFLAILTSKISDSATAIVVFSISSVLLTLSISAFSYHFVEKPCIDWGRAVARRVTE